MNWRRVRALVLLSVLVIAGVLAVALVGAQDGPPASQYDAVATGLDSPRHLRFGADGALYVPEAGHGVCMFDPGALRRETEALLASRDG